MPQQAASSSDGSPKVGALIRARRRQLQLTLQALSDVAGVSVGYLSQVERDQATPSLGTLAGIARGLKVGVDYFISAPRPEDALTRQGERARFSFSNSSIAYEQIGADFPGSQLSAFILHVPPGYRSETVSHEGEEILFVLEGEITQRLEGDEMVMRGGDSLHFRGNRPHSWSNDTNAPARLLWTGTLAPLRMRGERPRLIDANRGRATAKLPDNGDKEKGD